MTHRILYAINHKEAEDYITRQITINHEKSEAYITKQVTDQYKPIGAVTYKEAVLPKLRETEGIDTLLLRETLPGDIGIDRLIRDIRIEFPHIRLIVICIERPIGDAFLSFLTSLGIYDIINSDRPTLAQITSYILTPRTIRDAVQYGAAGMEEDQVVQVPAPVQNVPTENRGGFLRNLKNGLLDFFTKKEEEDEPEESAPMESGMPDITALRDSIRDSEARRAQENMDALIQKAVNQQTQALLEENSGLKEQVEALNLDIADHKRHLQLIAEDAERSKSECDKLTLALREAERRCKEISDVYSEQLKATSDPTNTPEWYAEQLALWEKERDSLNEQLLNIKEAYRAEQDAHAQCKKERDAAYAQITALEASLKQTQTPRTKEPPNPSGHENDPHFSRKKKKKGFPSSQNPTQNNTGKQSPAKDDAPQASNTEHQNAAKESEAQLNDSSNPPEWYVQQIALWQKERDELHEQIVLWQKERDELREQVALWQKERDKLQRSFLAMKDAYKAEQAAHRQCEQERDAAYTQITALENLLKETRAAQTDAKPYEAPKAHETLVETYPAERQQNATAQITPQVSERQNPSVKGHLILMTGAKRGAGNTTMALDLASSLVKSGNKTLLIEICPSAPTLPEMLGVPDSFSPLSALCGTDGGNMIESTILRPHDIGHLRKKLPDGLHLLSCTHNIPIRDGELDCLLEQCLKQYRYVVLDVQCEDTECLRAISKCGYAIEKMYLTLTQDRVVAQAAYTLLSNLLRAMPSVSPDAVQIIANRFRPNLPLSQAGLCKMLHIKKMQLHCIPDDPDVYCGIDGKKDRKKKGRIKFDSLCTPLIGCAKLA